MEQVLSLNQAHRAASSERLDKEIRGHLAEGLSRVIHASALLREQTSHHITRSPTPKKQ